MGKRMENRPRRVRRSAVTMLELVVVIAIMAALAGLVVPLVNNTMTQSSDTVTTTNLRRLQEVILNHYAVDMAGYVFPSATVVNNGLPIPDPAALTSDSNGVVRNAYIPQLAFLFVNPQTNSTVQTLSGSPTMPGWQGPYALAVSGRYPASAQIMSNGQTAAQNGFYSGTTALYGISSDQAMIDAWGNPIVIRMYDSSNNTMSTPLDNLYTVAPSGALPLASAVLVSAGPDGILTDSPPSQTDNVTLKLQ